MGNDILFLYIRYEFHGFGSHDAFDGTSYPSGHSSLVVLATDGKLSITSVMHRS